MKLKAAEILENKGINHRLIKLSEKGISFEDVIKYSLENINPDEICKTIIVKDKRNNRYALFFKRQSKNRFFQS